jgi:hypothetical protein
MITASFIVFLPFVGMAQPFAPLLWANGNKEPLIMGRVIGNWEKKTVSVFVSADVTL